VNERRETRDERRGGGPAPAGLFAGGCLVLLAYASAWVGAPTWGVWCMIVGSAFCMSAATALGAANSHVRSARVAFAAVFLFVVIVVGFGTPMLLAPDAPDGPLVLGLPLRVAIEFYGVGLLPVFVVPLLFALEFRSDGLDDVALAALRERCATVRPS
jgi:hypothetical protein